MRFTGERVVPGDMKSHIPTLQEHIARYNLALQAVIGKSVLDAACGTGYGSNLMLEAATSVTGADVDGESLKHAAAAYKTVLFVKTDLNKKFPAGKFDICVSFETVEHLDDPRPFLKNVKKNCGEFLFSVPLNNPSRYHKTVWTRDQLMELIGEYWDSALWYEQEGVNFSFYDKKNDDPFTFLIGHVKT